MKFYDREGRGYERIRQKQAWLYPPARKARMDARLAEKQEEADPRKLRERLSTARRTIPVVYTPTRYGAALTEPPRESILRDFQRQRAKTVKAEMQQLEAEREELCKSIRMLELEFASVYRMAEHVKDIKDRVKKLEKKLKPAKKRRKSKKRGR